MDDDPSLIERIARLEDFQFYSRSSAIWAAAIAFLIFLAFNSIVDHPLNIEEPLQV